MHRLTRPLDAVLLLGGLLGATTVLAAPPVAEETLRQLRADCRVEAEAAGLEGTAVEEFVDQCVADLLSVDLKNISGD